MITIYVKRIRSYMHGFLRYRNNKVMLCYVCLLYIAGVHKQRFNCSNTPVWYGDITCWSMLGLKDLTVQTFGDK